MASGCFSRVVLFGLCALAVTLFLTHAGCGSADPIPPDAPTSTAKTHAAAGAPAQIKDPRLPYAFELAPQILAGAAPEEDAGFAALRDLGVKTIISVDGSTPDVARAEKFGLRYVHLPIGYDSVPVQRQQEIAKLIEATDGPLYIHCHHGKHRGAAAAAAACVVAGLMDNDQAMLTMKTMQTGENYLGLWQAAREAHPVAAATLAALPVEYHATQPIPALAASMVLVDQHNDNMALCKAAAWTTPSNHPDLDPSHEALQLKELFAEMQRTPDFANRPADFQQDAKAAEDIAADLEAALKTWNQTAQPPGAPPPQAILDAYGALGKTCLTCHQLYRNIPQKPRAP